MTKYQLELGSIKRLLDPRSEYNVNINSIFGQQINF